MTSSAKSGALRAVMKLHEQDKQALIDGNLYELTISHRLAVYLEEEFPKYAVDCEYNTNINGQVDRYKRSTEDKKIRPDIIVHKRNDSESNLLVVEVKKAGRGSERGKRDIEKIRSNFNTPSLHYSHGLFVGVLSSRIDFVWIDMDRNTVAIEVIL
ncbi:MAG TPA: hypothetical protein PL051_02255 [Candidatus Saccharibacteria bacterium]|nr:hypothetical protein [Candidatus Saccharibacteria bacterium]